MKAIVTVIGRDKVGITAAVCALLAQHSINILDISQTVLQEYFTMVMLVDLSACTASIGEMSDLLEQAGRNRAVHPHPAGGHLQRHAPNLRAEDRRGPAAQRDCEGATPPLQEETMLNQHEIMQTIQMIDQQHLDVRTITMGISLLSCARPQRQACDAIYDKITRCAENLVATGEAIEKEFGIPIVNKRISVTPIALVAAASDRQLRPFAAALDRAAKATGVNFIGGFSALVQKGMTDADRAHSPPSRGPFHHRPGVLLRQRGLHQGGHQHGCGGPHGPDHQGAGRAHRGRGLRLRQAGGLLQRRGGQPFMAGAFHGVGSRKGHQRGRLRPRRGVPRPSSVKGAALRRGGRDHQKDRLPHHPHGPAGGPGGQPPPGRPPSALWTSLAPTPAVGTAWPASWRRWGWRSAAPTAPPPPWPAQRRGEEGGVMASSSVGGLSGAFIPVSEDEGMIAAASSGPSPWTSWRP